MPMDKLMGANYFYVIAYDVVYSTQIGHSVVQKVFRHMWRNHPNSSI